MPDAAYDVNHPNGSSRDGERIVHIYRLYRRQKPTQLTPRDGILGLVDRADQALDDVLGILGGGLILEREVRVPLVILRVDETPEVRSSLTYVSDGVPGENVFIDAPFRNAKGITRFRIHMRSYWTPVNVLGVAQDADAALLELQKLFDDYLYPGGDLTVADFALYFLNLDAPISAEDPFGASEWLIHPDRCGIRVNKSAERPYQRFAQLEFIGLQSNRDVQKAEDSFLAGLLGTRALKGLLDAVGLGSLASALETAYGAVQKVRGFLKKLQAVVLAATDVVRGAIQTYQAFIGQVRGVLDDTQTLISELEEGIDLVESIPDLIGDQLRLVQQNYPGLAGDEGVQNGVVAVDELRATRDFLLAILANPARFLPPGPATYAITLRVTPETSVERIAQQANVQADTLIAANNLQYPFVDARERPERKLARLQAEAADLEARDVARAAAGKPAEYAAQRAMLATRIVEAEAEVLTRPAQPNVLYAGDPIRVPQSRPERIPSIRGIDGPIVNLVVDSGELALSEDERILGIDLLLNDAGDLEWDADRVDLKLSRGLENMARVQNRYMRLPLGSLRSAPGIGSYFLADLGRWQTEADNRHLAHSLHKTISQDPRVRVVIKTRAESSGGRAFAHYTAVLIDGREFAGAAEAA